jgi:histone acetyltransferase
MNHSKSYENLKGSSKKALKTSENGFSDLNSKRISLNTWSREKKLEKLSNYSKHMHDCDDFQINYLLRIVLDEETLFSLICKEEDADTKHVYFFLFKLLRKTTINLNKESIMKINEQTYNDSKQLLNSSTSIESHLGKVPFQEPTITRALVNFITYKFGKSSDVELQYMFEALKLLLYCINMWRFETPLVFSKRLQLHFSSIAGTQNGHNHQSENAESLHLNEKFQKIISLYKLNYTRWLCFNFVPTFCESLEKHETVMTFGIAFLKCVFTSIKKEILDKIQQEKDKIPNEKRLICTNYLPKYVSFSVLPHFKFGNSEIFFE